VNVIMLRISARAVSFQSIALLKRALVNLYTRKERLVGN